MKTNSKLYGYAEIVPDKPVTAGQMGTWTVIYHVGIEGIKVGGSLFVFLPAPGCSTRWEPGFVTVRTDSSGVSLSTEVKNNCPISYHIHQHPYVKVKIWGNPLVENDKIFVTFGEPGGLWNGYKKLARAQEFAMDDVHFRIFIDVFGNSEYPLSSIPKALVEITDTAGLNVKPDKPHKIDLVLRDIQQQGRKCPLILSVKDKYGNVVPDYEGIIQLGSSNEQLKVQTETTFTKKDRGTKTISLSPGKENTGERIYAYDWQNTIIGKSNPVGSGFLKDYRIYFGDLHVMTANTNIKAEFTDKLGTPRDAFKFGRDVAGLDFTAVTDGKDAPDLSWKKYKKTADEFNKPGRFITIPAYEHDMQSGHKNIIYCDNKQPRSKCKTADELWKFLKGKKAIAIPHHSNVCSETNPQGWGPHIWKTHNVYYERLIEICQNRGSFEKDTQGAGIHFYGSGASVQNALACGLKLGFVGGTDNHRAQPGSKIMALHGIDYHQYRYGGITAVFAKQLTRNGLWNALWNRKCYATTGTRILLWIEINGYMMGSIVKRKTSETNSRKIKVWVLGTSEIERIDIVRNNKDIYTYRAQKESAEFSYTDTEKLQAVPGPECAKKNSWKNNTGKSVYYYVRVIQKDREMAWSSPIWF
jgi:hypothetical protein